MGMAKWVNEDDCMLMVFDIPPVILAIASISVHSSGCAFPATGHISMLDSAANARVLIIYLRDVRRTCHTFAIARERASSVAAFWISRLFRCLTIVCPTSRDGVDLFWRYRHRGQPRCLLTNRSCKIPTGRAFL